MHVALVRFNLLGGIVLGTVFAKRNRNRAYREDAMPANAEVRKLSMGVVIIIAMVTVLLPMCIGLSCGMGPMGMLGSSALGFGSDCVGTMTSVAQAAIIPGSPQSLILLLVAAFGVAFVLAAPPFAARPVRAMAEDPPAPPEDPRGVRLII